MNAVRIPISEQAVERFRQLPKQEQKVLKDKVATLLEQELNRVAAREMSLADFQEAMVMSNDDMVLTFGEEYLTQRNWTPAHD